MIIEPFLDEKDKGNTGETGLRLVECNRYQKGPRAFRGGLDSIQLFGLGTVPTHSLKNYMRK